MGVLHDMMETACHGHGRVPFTPLDQCTPSGSMNTLRDMMEASAPDMLQQTLQRASCEERAGTG